MKQVIIIFGPPGAGKGTQAELLADKLNLYYLETSKILEQSFKAAENLADDSPERFVEVGEEKYDILKEKDLWEKGILCSPPLVSYLIKKKIRECYDQGKNLVMAGSPRTLFEAQDLVPFLGDLYAKENIKMLLLDISPEQTLFRNSRRRICGLMRHPILYNKETEKLTVCPIDGSKLVARKKLDDPETIKVRIKEYQERTLPIVDYLKKNGFEIKKINGEQSVADVFDDIIKALK